MPQLQKPIYLDEDTSEEVSSIYLDDSGEPLDVGVKEQPESGLMKAWHTASAPLTEAPSRFARQVSQYINPGSETKGLRGVGSAYIEGLGDVISGLSSPLNLGLAGLTGGSSMVARAGLPNIARNLGIGAKILSAPVAAEGAVNLAQAEDIPQAAMGALELGGGILGMRARLPQVADAAISPTPPTIPEVKPTTNDILAGIVNEARKGPERRIAQEPVLVERRKPYTIDETNPDAVALEKARKGIEQGENIPFIGKEQLSIEAPSAEITPQPDITLPRVVYIKQPTKALVESLKEQGYIPSGVNEQGYPKMVRSLEPELPEPARTSEGGIKIGADVESLGKVLGSSLYSGDISTIATKELVQNSLDAIRHLDESGEIKVNIDSIKKTIEVSDNGNGLTRSEIETIFTDLGSSGKRADESAVGGFGLAKAAPLLGGEHVIVRSVARDSKTGKLMATSFSGTPDDLLHGVQLEHINVPEGTPTGTTVKVKVPEKASFYGADQFVRNVATYSDIKSQIKLKSYKGEENISAIRKPGKVLADLPGESADTRLTVPLDAKYGERSIINLILSNKGMFQGEKRLYLPQEVRNLPDKIIVDISSKVPEGHPDYPFTANRESLRGTVDDLVTQYIDENLVKPTISKQMGETVRIYNEMGFIRTKGERDLYYYDPKGKFSPEELTQIVQHPIMEEIGNTMHDIIDDTLLSLGKIDLMEQLEKVGFIFDERMRGLNVPNPGQKKAAVLVNPLQLMSSRAPDEAAAGFVHTTLHELAHLQVGKHNEDFTIHLGDVYEKFGASKAVAAQRRFQELVTGPDGNYNPEIQSILQRYNESRWRTGTTEDLLTGTGIGAKIKAGSEEAISEGDKSTRNRITLPPIINLKEPNEEITRLLLARGYKQTGPKKWELKPESGSTGKASKLREAYNLPRGLTTAFDISAPLRQGLPLITRKEWWKAWPEMVRAYDNEGAYKRILSKIEEKPLFQRNIRVKGESEAKSFAELAGLQLTDLKSLSSREEAIMSNWAEKVPGVRASNRAYTAFLNKLRADTFESLINDAEGMNLNPKADLLLSKEIAGFVNNSTGRGSLGALERHSKALTDLLFSPRLIASRVQMLNPVNYTMANPFVRKQYLKAMLSTSGAWMTVASLGYMMGGDVSLDTNSADFGKIRFGNTRLDPAGGFQQYLVLMSRLLQGKYTSSTSGREYELGQGFTAPTRVDVATDFAANKLHPVLKFGYDLFNASTNRPFYLGDKIAKMFAPMVAADIIELAKEDPILAAILGPLVASGMGTQSYGDKGQGSSIVPQEYDVAIP